MTGAVQGSGRVGLVLIVVRVLGHRTKCRAIAIPAESMGEGWPLGGKRQGLTLGGTWGLHE